MKQIDENTRISELTVGELRDLVRAVLSESVIPHTVHGLQGLADLLGVSQSTVKRYKGLLKLWAGRRNF